MRFEDQPVGTWALFQWIRPGAIGETVDIGVFPTRRVAVEAARGIAKVTRLQGKFGLCYKRSEKTQGAQVDGFHETMHSLEPPEYQPHQEIRLSDGRVVWLEDVDEALRTILDTPV